MKKNIFFAVLALTFALQTFAAESVKLKSKDAQKLLTILKKTSIQSTQGKYQKLRLSCHNGIDFGKDYCVLFPAGVPLATRLEDKSEVTFLKGLVNDLRKKGDYIGGEVVNVTIESCSKEACTVSIKPAGGIAGGL